MKLRRYRDNDELAELTALADGSLGEDRRSELDARVAASPELAALFAEQQRAVALVRGAAVEIEAPAGLRARIEAERSQKRATRLLTRPFVLASGVAAAAVVTLALVLTLPGSAGGPTIAEAAVLATRPSAGPPPAVQAGEPKLLARAVEGVAFPNWAETFAWRASGIRADALEGRATTTVFYANRGRRIGYTIVAGDTLAVPKDAAHVVRKGTELRVVTLDGRLVVTWLRRGRSCILSGAGVQRDILLKLAAWNGKGAVRF